MFWLYRQTSRPIIGASMLRFTRFISLSRPINQLKEDVALTSVRYPSVKRKPFASIQQSDLSVFKDVMGQEGVVTDPDILQSYNTDWLRTCRGIPQMFLCFHLM